jgi:hypothetical protein
MVLLLSASGIHAQASMESLQRQADDAQKRAEWITQRAELGKLIETYRESIRDIDLTYTYRSESLDPNVAPEDPTWKETVHLKYQGERFFHESMRWRDLDTQAKLFVRVCVYDGKKSTIYSSATKAASVVTGYDPNAEPEDRFFSMLRWPRWPARWNHPFPDMPMLIAWSHVAACPPPGAESVYGAETVVLDCGVNKIWLDPKHGGVIRRIEHRRSQDGPLFDRLDITQVREANGISFPVKMIETMFADEKREPKEKWNTPVRRRSFTVPEDGLRINCGLTQEDFSFQLPPGTKILDATAERHWRLSLVGALVSNGLLACQVD